MHSDPAFFASVQRAKSWYQFGKSDSCAKQAEQAEQLFRRYSERLEAELSKSPDGAFAKLSRAPHGSLSPRQAEQSKVQKYLLGDRQCAVTVLPGASAITGHLIALAPYVHRDGNYLICFFGYLSNLSELQEYYAPCDDDDVGVATTATILALYKRFMGVHKGDTKGEELLLAELQGHFALFVYNEQTQQAFAARDPSGEQELYWAVDPSDGSVAFTNTLDQLPTGEQLGRWRQIPPGHYVSGRTPVLRQYALTPEQLEVREHRESTNLGFLTDDDSSDSSVPHTSKAASAINMALARLSRRHS